jgi:hypothetical protein
MGMQSPYQDLLWDFAYAGTGEESCVTLRVFKSEQEMFETEWEAPRIKFSHIQKWLKSSYSSRTELAKDRLPKEMLWDMGRQLWDAIPTEAKQPLLQATPDHPARLKISSNSATVDDLPWEWLNDGEDPPFALQASIRLARSVPMRLALPPMSIEPPLRVLLVLTNPKEGRLLDAPREIDAIRPRLEEEPYQLTVLWKPSMQALMEALKEGPHILHYIGHTGVEHGEGVLILHDDLEVTHWIPGSQLSAILPMTVRLLCLSTCFTANNYQIQGLARLAHSAAQFSLPTAIVNRYPVSELGVRTFWMEFYSSLANHRGNVNEAFPEAQSAVKFTADTGADWGSFSLVIRDMSGDVMRLVSKEEHSKQRFEEEVQAQFLSRLANNLAERMKGYGADRPATIQKSFDEEASAASHLTDKLFGGE